jgi:thioredoxin-like negative regulator of GroEL
LKKDVKALVLFAPDWSTAGNKIAVAMEALGKPVFRVDIDKSADLAMRFSIRQSPYLILFEQGFAIDSAVELTDAMLKQMSS